MIKRESSESQCSRRLETNGNNVKLGIYLAVYILLYMQFLWQLQYVMHRSDDFEHLQLGHLAVVQLQVDVTKSASMELEVGSQIGW